jgi:hypothetical protein
VPDRVVTAPPVAVARLAEQLKVDVTQIGSYGRRAQTRTEHVRLAARYLGWRPAGTLEFKELDEFLLARAMEHDSSTLLFRLACEYLISARAIRPSSDTLVRRVAHSREQAQHETYDRLAHEFTPERCAKLDGLLTVDASLGMPRLRWLSTGPMEASASAVKAEVEKLRFLRGLGADRMGMSVLPDGTPPVPGHHGPPPNPAGPRTAGSAASVSDLDLGWKTPAEALDEHLRSLQQPGVATTD